MNFDFSEDQVFIRDQARNFLSQECNIDVVRGVLDTEKAYDDALWQKLSDNARAYVRQTFSFETGRELLNWMLKTGAFEIPGNL